jgi:DNA polymerase III alpha subunit (gram-positive type)
VILCFDCETGGINPKESSLLTVYFVVLDDKYNAVEELELTIKNEKNEPYKVTGEALGINKINLVELHKNGISRGEAALKVADLIMKHSNNGKDKLICLGHQINFDIGFINEHLVNQEIWQKYVSYRTLDTATIANFLKLKGSIPKEVPGSLSSLAKHFQLNMDFELAHNAKFDVLMTVAIFEKMLAL